MEDNHMLCKIPSAQEIKDVVFSMNADGAPGPDGFGGHFYQTYWSIVANDVILAIQDFFVNGKLLQNLNSNLIVLIPKMNGAVSMSDFRPIALANFIFKILTKIIADRLASIAPKLVSEHQRGFIPGRQISDCVIVASEAINVLHKKSFA
ncbi:RNA-directed DNA polymerase (Reverse transcriptase), partial [Trifolium medium]|nr:RNA-directed DNA polymerase (Reverse transcriptase) [Trifolium medium]